MHLEILLFKNSPQLGLAVVVIAMSLDSHVVDRSSSPRPGGLNSRQAHECVPKIQDPERRMEEKGLRRGQSPREVISRFLSLSLSLS